MIQKFFSLERSPVSLRIFTDGSSPLSCIQLHFMHTHHGLLTRDTNVFVSGPVSIISDEQVIIQNFQFQVAQKSRNVEQHSF